MGLVTSVVDLEGIKSQYSKPSQSEKVNESFKSVLKDKFSNSTEIMDAIFEEASSRFGVSVDLIKSVAKAESNFNTKAVSKAGAIGVMQLMPATAASLGVSNAYDPYQNIMGGAKYIRQMLDKYDGNVSLALAAYNAGSNNVDKYGGIPPFAETQNYVAKITGYLEEGVTIPDTQTVYASANTVNGDADVTYQYLNTFAKEILTEIFSYDDYMKYLTALLDKDKTNLALSLSVKSSSEEEENTSQPDSLIAYQNLTGAHTSDLVNITTTENDV